MPCSMAAGMRPVLFSRNSRVQSRITWCGMGAPAVSRMFHRSRPSSIGGNIRIELAFLGVLEKQNANGAGGLQILVAEHVAEDLPELVEPTERFPRVLRHCRRNRVQTAPVRILRPVILGERQPGNEREQKNPAHPRVLSRRARWPGGPATMYEDFLGAIV